MLDNVETVHHIPDTILLDVNMPVINGFEFMEEYKKFKPQIKSRIKVFMIASSINPVDINKATTNSEIGDYISNPINPIKLQSIFSVQESTDES